MTSAEIMKEMNIYDMNDVFLKNNNNNIFVRIINLTEGEYAFKNALKLKTWWKRNTHNFKEKV